MKKKINPIPERFHTVTVCLTLKDSLRAIAFYKKAFGAKELEVSPSPDGKSTMNAMIQIGDSVLMLGDEQLDQNCKSAETLGFSPIALYVYVEDSDSAFKQAVDAGAKTAMPMNDMFWGDRCGSVKDPFGYTWTLATHVRDLSEKEIQEGAKAFFAKAAM